MRGFLAGLLLALTAVQASAGAWPREKGRAFVALSHTASTPTRTLLAPTTDLRGYSGIFAEYGLTERWTIGVDAGIGSGNDDSASTALVFVRRPVWSGDGGGRIAADFGIGTQDDEAFGRQVRLRPGLAWGRGFESRYGNGWFGIEAAAELRLPGNDLVLKADGTAGIKPNENWMLIFQVQSGRYPDEPALVRLAPSAVRRINGTASLQLGVNAAVVGDDAIGVKLGLWLEF
jgi:hypothetical protein